MRYLLVALLALPLSVSAQNITIEDASADEDDGEIVFTVSLSSPASETLDVDYSTENQTANNDDYTSGSGTIQFSIGESEKTISISISVDELEEEDETFLVKLSNLGAGSHDSIAVGTIFNDDYAPKVGDDLTYDLIEDQSIDSEQQNLDPLLVNFSDQDHDIAQLSVEVVRLPTNGFMEVLQESGTLGHFFYIPDENFNGKDTLFYLAYDGANYSEDTAIAIFDVAFVNDEPQINGVSDDTICANGETIISLEAHISDVDHELADLSLIGGQIRLINSEINDFEQTDIVQRFDPDLWEVNLSVTKNQLAILSFEIGISDNDFNALSGFDTILVYVYPHPEPDFVSEDVCLGDPTLFSSQVSVQPGTTLRRLLWDFQNDGDPDAGALNVQYTYPTPGKKAVSLEAFNNFECSATIIDSVTVFPEYIPMIDIEITDDSVSLFAVESAVSYQWLKGSALIPEADGGTLQKIRVFTGTYRLRAVNADGCEGTSEPFTVTPDGPTGLANNLDKFISLYPNPSGVEVTSLDFRHAYQGVVTMKLINMAGQVVYEVREEKRASSATMALPTGHLPAGIYLVKLETEEGEGSIRMIVE